jgi:hypothetical protein
MIVYGNGSDGGTGVKVLWGSGDIGGAGSGAVAWLTAYLDSDRGTEIIRLWDNS